MDGEPNATDKPGMEEEECFPEAARYEICENGELIDKRTEPIAADAREGKDGKRNALLKLIAGLINVGAMETRLPLSWRYRYLQNRHGHPDAGSVLPLLAK